MNQLLNRLPEAQTKLFFGVLILFAAITVYFSPLLAAIEILITALLLVYHLLTRRSREQKVTGFIDTLSRNIAQAGKDTMTNSPFPMVIFRPENGEVIWSNDRFLDLCSDRDHIFDTHITTAVPKFSAQWLFDGKTQCPDEYVIQGRRYQVFGQLVSVGSEEHPSYVATTYWLDVTDFSDIRDRYYATRPVVSIITIDNYEELIRNSTDSRRAKVRTGIEREISKWIAPTNGLVCRYDRDRYLFIFEEQHLAAYRQSKFALLEGRAEDHRPYGLTATLSIGIGVGSTFEEMFQFATLALEMAIAAAATKWSSKIRRPSSSTAAVPRRRNGAPRSRAGSWPALWTSSSPPLPRSSSWGTNSPTWTRWALPPASVPSPAPGTSLPISSERTRPSPAPS